MKKSGDYPFWYFPNWFVIAVILCFMNGPSWQIPFAIGLLVVPMYDYLMGLHLYITTKIKRTPK